MINIEKSFTSFEDKEISIGDIEDKISQINDFLAGNIHKVSIEKKVVLSVFNSAKAALYNELVNFEDELLVKMYYVGFSILMILIILKLVFKKN
mgnify:CR=1 FL=1